MLIFLIVSIIILFLIVLWYGFKVQKRNEEYQRTSFDGRKYDGLNDIYEFDDHKTFFVYELLDFEKTVQNKDGELVTIVPYEGAKVIRVVTSKEQKHPHKLNEIKQTIINQIPARPFTTSQLITLSDAIIESRENYRLIKEQKRKQALEDRYAKANSSEDRQKLSKTGVQSVNEYQEKLESDKRRYEADLEKNYEHMSRIISEAGRNIKQKTRG